MAPTVKRSNRAKNECLSATSNDWEDDAASGLEDGLANGLGLPRANQMRARMTTAARVESSIELKQDWGVPGIWAYREFGRTGNLGVPGIGVYRESQERTE